MNPLYVSLGVVVIAFVGLIVAGIVYVIEKRMIKTYAKAVSDLQNAHKTAENSKLKAVVEPLSLPTGGLPKRIAETIEIAQAIRKHAPQLFKQHPTIAYSLQANEQFLQQVYESVADELGPDVKERIAAAKSDEDVFQKIYEEAGIVPPVFARKRNPLKAS